MKIEVNSRQEWIWCSFGSGLRIKQSGAASFYSLYELNMHLLFLPFLCARGSSHPLGP